MTSYYIYEMIVHRKCMC